MDEKKTTLNELREKDAHIIVGDANGDKADLDEAASHYVWMEKKFIKERMWTWIINFIAYAAMITSYFLIDGKEMIFCLYLPLDLLFNLCKASFYFMNYAMEKYEESKEEKLKEALRIQQRRAEIEAKLKEGIGKQFTKLRSFGATGL